MFLVPGMSSVHLRSERTEHRRAWAEIEYLAAPGDPLDEEKLYEVSLVETHISSERLCGAAFRHF